MKALCREVVCRIRCRPWETQLHDRAFTLCTRAASTALYVLRSAFNHTSSRLIKYIMQSPFLHPYLPSLSIHETIIRLHRTNFKSAKVSNNTLKPIPTINSTMCKKQNILCRRCGKVDYEKVLVCSKANKANHPPAKFDKKLTEWVPRCFRCLGLTPWR